MMKIRVVLMFIIAQAVSKEHASSRSADTAMAHAADRHSHSQNELQQHLPHN